MSLTASTGGMAMSAGGAGSGGGGLIMAHQAQGGAAALGNTMPQANATATGGTLHPPPLLGADLADRNQAISLKQVKNVAHLPLVAVDLFTNEPHVALFPPKSKDPTVGALPVVVGKMKPDLYFHSNELAHKTLRKYLTKAKSFAALRSDSLTTSTDPTAVIVRKPYHWLGLRRIQDAPNVIRSSSESFTSSSADSVPLALHAIAEDVAGNGATLVDSTLDGSSAPQGDDFDRVVWRVRLHSSKKALAILPEEAVQMILHQAQYHVATKTGTDPDSDEITDFPVAVAVPAWASHDAAIEALMDATPSSSAGGVCVIFQRCVCALAGALLPKADGQPCAPLARIYQVRTAMQKEFQRIKANDPDAVFDEEVTLLLFGMTGDGMECTAVHISSENSTNICAFFGNFTVIANVSYQAQDPLSLMEKCTTELEQTIEKLASEADGPTGIILYGTIQEQDKMGKRWDDIRTTQKEWKDVPVFTTKSDCVALGAAVLGAVSHGRSTKMIQSGQKRRCALGIVTQNVAPVALGIQYNYHGDDSSKWTPVKTIFDFDRRIPAGPYEIELKASEVAVHRSGSENLTDDELLKAAKDNEGSRGIPIREEAALNLKIQLVQKWTRDGEWKRLGDAKGPLWKPDETDETKKVACESVVLELSLGVTGIITTNFFGERQSVVQATKSARNSALRYYIGIVVAILFFGGFLLRSYWEEYSFQRDVDRLLAYYQHVVPGNIQATDRHSARYLVWKYRANKERLWKTLEKKYGQPVLHAYEWDEAKNNESENASKGEDVVVDLDESSSDSQQSDTRQGKMSMNDNDDKPRNPDESSQGRTQSEASKNNDEL